MAARLGTFVLTQDEAALIRSALEGLVEGWMDRSYEPPGAEGETSAYCKAKAQAARDLLRRFEA